MQLLKPPTPRQIDRYARILQAARDLLAESGYEGLQMRVLAERAGVSPMTLYNRYGNKDDLILTSVQEMLNGLRGLVVESGKQGIEHVLYDFELIANQIMETPEYAKAMALMLFNGQAHSPIVDELLLVNLRRARGQLAEMRTLREINDSIDLELLARGLSTCSAATVLLWMKEVISDEDFKMEYVRAPLLVLVPAMTRSARNRYIKFLGKVPARRASTEQHFAESLRA